MSLISWLTFLILFTPSSLFSFAYLTFLLLSLSSLMFLFFLPLLAYPVLYTFNTIFHLFQGRTLPSLSMTLKETVRWTHSMWETSCADWTSIPPWQSLRRWVARRRGVSSWNRAVVTRCFSKLNSVFGSVNLTYLREEFCDINTLRFIFFVYQKFEVKIGYIFESFHRFLLYV